jgi:uncharacterized membrane protein YfcA
MWIQYRKTLIPTQVVVATVCLLTLLLFKAPWQGIVAIFVAMQIGAVLGARWAIRLRRKIEASRQDRLPLAPR